MDPAKFLQVVKSTIFDSRATEEELIAFLLVCNRYNLDPFRKEIYAFRQGDKIQPIVGIDGWYGVVNERPEFDGLEYEVEHDKDGNLVSITCKMYRKDRARPMGAPEYLKECKRNTPAWNNMPHRMLRHRAYIQTARTAFGISGIMDPDEFEQMVETQARVIPSKPIPSSLAELTKQMKPEPIAELSESVTSPIAQTATQPSVPALSERPARTNELNELIGEIREFEEWALESEQVAVWNSLCASQGIPDARNLRSYGIAGLRPLATAIRMWRSNQNNGAAAPTPPPASDQAQVAASAPPAPSLPPQPRTIHDEVSDLRSLMPGTLLYDTIAKHGGVRGVPNFGLSPEKQGVLLADLRSLARK